MAIEYLSIYNHGRFSAYLLALRRAIASFSAMRHELIILDLGCSSGRFDEITRLAMPNALIIGVDLDLHSLRLASKASVHHALLADIRKIPLEKSIADLALCLEVIEHMPKTDALKTLAHIKKTLKTNGLLLLSTPNRKSPTYISETIAHLFLGRRYNGGDSAHVHIYDNKEITSLLSASGLEVINNLGYWVLPLTFEWMSLAASKNKSFDWLWKLLAPIMRFGNSILTLVPRLGFLQILLCANSKRVPGMPANTK